MRHKEAEREHDAQLSILAGEKRGPREEEKAAGERLKRMLTC